MRKQFKLGIENLITLGLEEDKKEEKKEDKKEEPKEDEKNDTKGDNDAGEVLKGVIPEDVESNLNEGDNDGKGDIPSDGVDEDNKGTGNSQPEGQQSQGTEPQYKQEADKGGERKDDSQGKDDNKDGDSKKEVKKEPPADPNAVNGDKKDDKSKASYLHSGTMVIVSFPCMGKSKYAAEHRDCKYLNPDMFTTTIDGQINKQFPSNYIERVKWHLTNNNWKYLFLSSHKEVRDALKRYKIPYTVLYPKKDRLEELLKVCDEREYPPAKKELIKEHFDAWVDEAAQEKNSYPLAAGEFISDELFDVKYKFLAN